MQAAHVEVKASDAVSGVDRVEWQIDGGPWLHGPSGSFVHFTTTGEYQLRTRARDVAGNLSAAQLENVQVDADAPANTTTQPVGQVSNPYQVAVTGTDADSGVASVQWQVDNGTDRHGRPRRSRDDHGRRPAQAQDACHRRRRQRVRLALRHGRRQRRARRQRAPGRHHHGRLHPIWRSAPVT